jgi:hypothetical protein
MKMTTQGKEYATWVKVKGQWLYKTRRKAGRSKHPSRCIALALQLR